MKQFALLAVLTVAGGLASLFEPFWGVLLYYTWAVLQPQHLWDWALPGSVRWSLAAACIVMISVALHLPRLLRRFEPTPIFVLVLVYGTLVGVSVVTAFDPRWAQAWAQDLGKVLLMVVIALVVIHEYWHVRVLGVMILMAVGYIAYEVNYNYVVHGHRLDVFHYGYGGLDNNGAGLLMAMGLPFAYAFAATRWSSWSAWRRAAAIVGGGLITHAVMMTYSRGAMLSLAIGMLWLLWRHRPRWQSLAGGPLVFVGVLALAGAEIREEFMSTRHYRDDPSALSRLDSWAGAWEIAWEHPLFGTGLRNSHQYSLNYGMDRQNRTIHNQYLQIAADSGIPTAAVYIAMLATAVLVLGASRKRCLRAWHGLGPDADPETKRTLSEAEKLCLASQASLIIFAFDGMFLSLETFELAWLLIVMAAVMPGATRRLIASLGASEATDDEPVPTPAPTPASAPSPAPPSDPAPRSPLPWPRPGRPATSTGIVGGAA